MRSWNYTSMRIVECIGGDSLVAGVQTVVKDAASIVNPKADCIMFASSAKWKEQYLEKLYDIENAFIIIEKDLCETFSPLAQKNHVIVTNNPRLYFAKALTLIVNHNKKNKKYRVIEGNITIGENVVIGENSIIEPFVFLDHDVTLGDNVVIKSGAKIRENTWIEDNVTIGENTVIGAQGFGIEKDEDGTNIRIPHIGGVRIGAGSEIGALTSIVAGTVNPTVIEENCFIDDLNHIAHNCVIGKGTLTTGCVEIGGSAAIGRCGYISPNVTIRNGISLGEACFVGQASSVQKSFADHCALVGSPAREFERKE